jgi:hypothetical protein
MEIINTSGKNKGYDFEEEFIQDSNDFLQGKTNVAGEKYVTTFSNLTRNSDQKF